MQYQLKLTSFFEKIFILAKHVEFRFETAQENRH